MAKAKRTAKEFGVYKIVLKSGENREEFEKFMQSEVLENTITFRDGHSSQDELYARTGGGEENSYIWVISRTPSLGGEFIRNADASAAFKGLRAKVESHGEVFPL